MVSVLNVLADPQNYPVNIRFGRPPILSNEKINLSSMFHGLFAIGVQISPVTGSSGIQILEASTFRLECFQSLVGENFVVIAYPKQPAHDKLLQKVYELHSDYALRN